MTSRRELGARARGRRTRKRDNERAVKHMVRIRISDIKIGERFREDLGDIDGLARSIDEVDMIQPVVVDTRNELKAGLRRIKAAETLGRTEVPVVVVPATDDRRIEIHENQFRKDYTASEMVAIKRYLEPQLAREAQERRKAGRPSSDSDEGRTDEKIAKAVGVGKDKLRQAEYIVEAAEEEPEKYTRILQDVNEGRKSISRGAKDIRHKKTQEKLLETASHPLQESYWKGELNLSKSIIISELPEEDQPPVVRKVIEESPNDELTKRLVTAILDQPEKIDEILAEPTIALTPRPKAIQEFESKYGRERPKFEKVSCLHCGGELIVNWPLGRITRAVNTNGD